MTLENTAEVEKSNIDELRRRMKGLMTEELFRDDNVFERFLRARNQNLDAAEAMLKNHIKWREINKVDNIKNEFKPSEVLIKYASLERLGFDKDGAPVIYCCFGGLDTRGIYRTGKKSDFLTYFMQVLEENVTTMKEQSEKIGIPTHQWVMIFDYDNFKLSNATHKPTVEILISMISMYEANYPERLKAAYLINGSLVFQFMWALCRPILSGPTFQKVRIFGKSGYHEELRKVIDPDVLPAFLGGDRTDPDGNPKCHTVVRFGGTIPDHYFYGRKASRRLSILPEAMSVAVSRNSKAEVDVEVIKAGSNLEWEFSVRSKDIDFCVVYRKYRNDDEVGEVVYPKQRVEAGGCSETGIYRCEQAGVYSLVFDNSYSWLHSKHVCYAVSLVAP